MNAGTITHIVEGRGFGFVRSDGRDIFFHASQLAGLEFDERLLERRVVFDEIVTAKGPKAVNVRAAD